MADPSGHPQGLLGTPPAGPAQPQSINPPPPPNIPPQNVPPIPSPSTCPVINHIEMSSGSLALTEADIYVPGTEPEFYMARFYNSVTGANRHFGLSRTSIFDARFTTQSDRHYTQGVLSDSDPLHFRHTDESAKIMIAQAVMPQEETEEIRSDALAMRFLEIGGPPVIQYSRVNFQFFLPDGTTRNFSQLYERTVPSWYSSGQGGWIAVGKAVSTPGVYDAMTFSDSPYELVLHMYGERKAYHFNRATERLVRITTPEGNELTIVRDSNNDPTSLIDGAGRTYTVTRNGQNKITKISDQTGRNFLYGYDQSNRLISYTEPEGHVTQYEYNSTVDKNLITKIKFSNGGERTYEYDNSKRIIKRTDAEGGVQQYIWDTTPWPPQNPIITNVFIDENGGRWTKTYNSVGDLIREVDAMGETTTFAYNANKRKIKEVGPLGGIRRWEYDRKGNLTAMILPDSRIIQYSYNDTGFLIGETNAMNEGTHWVYDTYLRNTKIIYPDGAEMTFEYDAKGNQTSAALPGKPAKTTTFDVNGLPDIVTDPNGNEWDYDYDDRSSLVRFEDPLGRVTAINHDLRGRITKVEYPDSSTEEWSFSRCCGASSTTHKDQSGNTWTRTHDLLNRTVSMIDPTGITTSIGYDSAGFLSEVTLPSGTVTKYGYDSNGRLILVTLPQVGDTPTVIGYQRNIVGNVTAIIDPAGSRTELFYDTTRRLIERRYADGGHDTFSYDEANRVISSADAFGRVTSREYTSRGFLNKITNPLGAEVCLEYDSAGLLTKLTDPRSNSTAWEYTDAGEVKAEVDPLGKRIDYTYDVARQLSDRTDARNILTKYRYDNIGRLAARDYPSRGETFSYSSIGNLNEARWGNGDTDYESYTYDSANRMLSHYQPWFGSNGETITYEYNLDGRLSGRSGPWSETIAYVRDAQGRLTSLSSRSAGTFDWTIDEAGRIRKLDRPNGVLTEYGYDNVSRISRIHHMDSGLNNILDILYSYDSSGQITQQDEDTITITYGYDNAGQLTSTDYPDLNLDWTYDLAGNRLTEVRDGNASNYTTNAANELTDIDGNGMTYDSAGNMLTRNNGSETFTWDEENRLTRYENGTSTVVLHYAHDWRVIVRGEGDSKEVFAYDQDDFAAKENVTTGETVLFFYSRDFIDNVLGKVSSNTKLYHLIDHMGSVRKLTDGAGTISTTANYEPWGASRGVSVPDLGFMARPKLAGNDNWLRYRHYSSGAGRFNSRDLLGIFAGPNFYQYALNSPVFFGDPFGLAVIEKVTSYLNPTHSQIVIKLDDGTVVGVFGYYPYIDPSSGWTQVMGGAATAIGVGQGKVYDESQIDGSVVESFSFCDDDAAAINDIFDNMAKQSSTAYNFITANCGTWASQMIGDVKDWVDKYGQ